MLFPYIVSGESYLSSVPSGNSGVKMIFNWRRDCSFGCIVAPSYALKQAAFQLCDFNVVVLLLLYNEYIIAEDECVWVYGRLTCKRMPLCAFFYRAPRIEYHSISSDCKHYASL